MQRSNKSVIEVNSAASKWQQWNEMSGSFTTSQSIEIFHHDAAAYDNDDNDDNEHTNFIFKESRVGCAGLSSIIPFLSLSFHLVLYSWYNSCLVNWLVPRTIMTTMTTHGCTEAHGKPTKIITIRLTGTMSVW